MNSARGISRNNSIPGQGQISHPSQKDIEKSSVPTIIFNVCKKEIFTPKQGLKILEKKLRGDYNIIINQDELNMESLLKGQLIIICGPRERFSEAECTDMKHYVKLGGSILVLLGEGGEQRFSTNINYFLENYGININNDAVIRTMFYKYFHPKEVCVQKGVLNKAINIAAGKEVSSTSAGHSSNEDEHLTFLYPYGATLIVEKPAIPILSSGHISYPLNRPVAAVYGSKSDKGRIAVIGSVHIFEDSYINKEENSVLQNIIFEYLLQTTEFKFNEIDAEAPDVNDYNFLPDSKSLAERYKPCLQESEELPADFTQLFVDRTFKFDTNLIPEAIKLYKDTGVKHAPLSLILPAFETPLPSLRPAVYPPSLQDPMPPSLDLFDLDEHFASEDVRLAHLTNRCENKDMEYYVQKSGEILGISSKLEDEHKHSAKHILEFVFKKITQFKKNNYEATPTYMNNSSNASSMNKIFAKSFGGRNDADTPPPTFLAASKPPTPLHSPHGNGY
ncbi:intraflagellar transport protein 52 [Acrasis kona]|uniref:Intraflagellar transport protein 52 n=1 Tax=Acrasis kona TaxID=1008807 RepID=A0AAW2Z9Z7_9EUKA